MKTEIINYASVYFPSVPEETRTNGIVSIVDITPPRYSNVNQSKSVVTAGEAVEVYAYWQDGVRLNYTWLETNESGTWENVSYLAHSGSEAWSNFTIQATQEGVVCWRIHANDTAGNENVTPVLCFDVVPPAKAPWFDTRSSSNPYPSIPGMFNGTITPSCNLTVSKLYTYPCPGTGGHTKFIKIWNNTDWNVTAAWNGYSGDWHNLTFNNSFSLYENETYNYTIRTGSYVQIHHKESLQTSSGCINCTGFTDVNGKYYDDWIPAIKLE